MYPLTCQYIDTRQWRMINTKEEEQEKEGEEVRPCTVGISKNFEQFSYLLVNLKEYGTRLWEGVNKSVANCAPEGQHVFFGVLFVSSSTVDKPGIGRWKMVS